MRTKVVMLSMIFITLLWVPQSTNAQCVDMDSERMKTLLGDATFDNFRMTKIDFADNPYDIEFRVDLLKKYTYKLIFDMSKKSEGVVVKLFDLGGKKDTAAPKLLYTSSEDVMDKNAIFNISFEAPKTRMLIKYEVKDATYEGCISFVLGYIKEDKFKADLKVK